MSRQSKPLSKATAADVMTSPAAYVEVETPLREIARLMILEGISAVPVVDQAGNLAGIVSEGDLIRRNTKGQEAKRSWWLDLFDAHTLHSAAFLAYLERHGLRAKDVMTREVISVVEDTGIVEVARLFEAHHVKRVPVLRGTRLIGVVSRTDLLQALMRAAPMHRLNSTQAGAGATRHPQRGSAERQDLASIGTIPEDTVAGEAPDLAESSSKSEAPGNEA
jgi:CBS domain-containing protein